MEHFFLHLLKLLYVLMYPYSFLLLSSVNKLFCDGFCMVLQEGQMYRNGLHFAEKLTFSAVGFALKAEKSNLPENSEE